MASRYEIESNVQGLQDAAAIGLAGTNLLTAQAGATVAITGLQGMYTAITGVTATASNDTFTKTSHGLSNDQIVGITGLTGGAGLLTYDTGSRLYYVINVATNTFQLADSPGGTPANFTTDVTAATITRSPTLVLYTTETGATTTSNPTTSDSSGRLSAWVKAPDYDLTISSSGKTTQTVKIRRSTSGMFNVHSYGAVGDDSTDDTAAVQAANTQAGNAGRGEVYFPNAPGFVCSSAITIPSSVTWSGEGDTSKVRFTGTGAFITYTSSVPLTLLRELRIELSNDSSQALVLDNTFLATCVNVYFRGQWTNATDASYRNQVGVRTRNNAGDNYFIGCKFLNLGEAVQSGSIMNYWQSCHFGTCRRSMHVDSGTNAGGFSVTGCTFVGDSSNPSLTTHHILIDVISNQCNIENCWFEGCDVGWQLGVTTTAWANQFFASNCYVSSRTKCIDIQNAGQPRLSGITFAGDPGATPTAMTVSSNAQEGTVAGLRNIISGAPYDFSYTDFPTRWQFDGRLATKIGGMDIDFDTGNVRVQTVGGGFNIKEGTNARMGVATLSSGTVTVSTTKVTANSRIFLTKNSGTSTGALRVSARTAGTSFTITSSDGADTSTVAWLIMEPS